MRPKSLPAFPLTYDFKETVRARARRDPDFRRALLCEAVEWVITGELATGKALLRDYVNATIGFQNLELRTHSPAESLMPMPGPRGSPSAANLANILSALQKTEGVVVRAGPEKVRARSPEPASTTSPKGQAIKGLEWWKCLLQLQIGRIEMRQRLD